MLRVRSWGDLSKHGIDWDEWPNELGRGRNIFWPKATAVSFHLCRWQFVDAKEFAVFPNPDIGVVGADPARIGPGVDRQ